MTGDAPTPASLRRLVREHKVMGPRLAQLEFRELLSDLDNPGLFDLAIDYPAAATVPRPLEPVLVDDPVFRRLPRLAVPLGKVAWLEDPESLPVMGIMCGPTSRDGFRADLRTLFAAQNSKPFARFVFLCETLRPIPFFGRYGFAYEYLGGRPDADGIARLAARYGMAEIRTLDGADLVWSQAGASPAP
jgi:hypothetical protein